MPSDLEPAAQPVAPLLLDVEGMKCGGCVRSVEQRLLAQPGVRQASVNLLNRTAWVGLDPQAITAEPAQPLIEALAAMGYTAAVRDLDGDDRPLSLEERRQQVGWWQRWRQLMVALLLLLFSVSGHLAEAGQLPFAPLADICLHALVATAALLLPGRPILVQGWRSAWALMPSR